MNMRPISVGVFLIAGLSMRFCCGVELSVTRHLDVVAGRLRPMAGQTNHNVEAAINTRDGGFLETCVRREPPYTYLLSQFAADGGLAWSLELTNWLIYPPSLTGDSAGNVVFIGRQRDESSNRYVRLSPHGAVVDELRPVQTSAVSQLIHFQGGYLVAESAQDSFLFRKLSSNLAVEWERRVPPLSGPNISPPVYPPCRALLAGPGGDFIFSASGYLVRMTTNGAVVWAKGIWGSSTLVQLLRISDGYLLAGYGEYRAKGDVDYLIVKSNERGEHQWTRIFGGTPVGSVGGEMLTDIAPTDDGGFLLVGQSDTEEVSGNKTVPGIGTWIVKTDERGLKQGELLIPESVAGASHLIRTPSGYALIGSRYHPGTGSWDPQVYRWDLSIPHRVHVRAFSDAGQAFNLDVSTNLSTWAPVVVGFSGELEFREIIGPGHRFWRAYPVAPRQ